MWKPLWSIFDEDSQGDFAKEYFMILSARLNAIAQLVPTAHTLADIGTDHGYIPFILIQQSE
jgi:hypothetical protein